MQGFLAGTGAGASGSLACPVVFSSLFQEPRHCLSKGSFCPWEQELPQMLGAGRRPLLLNHHP